jgi:hypothetical protein
LHKLAGKRTRLPCGWHGIVRSSRSQTLSDQALTWELIVAGFEAAVGLLGDQVRLFAFEAAFAEDQAPVA